MPTGPLLPAWLVIPLASVAMIAVGAHLLWIQDADVPSSRRRIRTLSGLLMLVVTPMLAHGLLAGAPSPRTFVLLWTCITVLVTTILVLALLDAVNNVRLHRLARRDRRAELSRLLTTAPRDRADARPR